MVQYKHVFSPFSIGNVEVKNRIALAPITFHATHDGFVPREMVEFVRSFARGGPGLITIGEAFIDRDYSVRRPAAVNIGDDRILPGLSALVEVVHRYGAKASIELNHAGRSASPQFLQGRNPIGPSPIPSQAEEISAKLEGRKPARIQEMNQDMIDQVIDNFVSASDRCLRAGFDMVMIHGGHGHLLAQFASPYSNKRTDAYGGSLENRARFAIEVLTAIRKKVGNRLAIDYRVSADELVPEGMHLEEAIEFIKMIQDKIDMVHVSLSLVADPRYDHYHFPPTYLPHAYNVQRAEKIKKAVQIPVACVGAIMDLAMAEQILAEGKADIVTMARALIADPEMVKKTYHGELDDIRPCVRCNLCVEGLRRQAYFRCAVNPLAGRELEYSYIRPADKKKKVVIVGGGPAGMEAAMVASSRGHKVTLYEKEEELGGALRAAAAPSFKADMKRYLDWMVKKTVKSPVEVKLSTKATASSIKAMKPDVLIVAVGAEPFIPDIPGIKKSNVVLASDVHLGTVKTGKTVVVIGAGLTGAEAALHLAQQGKKVTLISRRGEGQIAEDASAPSRSALMDLLHQHSIEFKTEVNLEEITDTGVVVIDKKWNRFDIPADTVVLARGFKTPSKTVKAFQELAREVYIIGDCSNPRDLMAAIHDAFNVAVEI